MAFADFSVHVSTEFAIFSLVLQFRAKVALEERSLLEEDSPLAEIVIKPPVSICIRTHSMTCQELAHRIQRLQPDAGTRDVARLCLLLTNLSDDVSVLDDDSLLTSTWREASLRLQAATDQHAAMTEELESLARS